MDLLVRLHMIAACERFAAEATDVRGTPGMQVHVPHQIHPVEELFRADDTLERLILRLMALEVALEQYRVGESLATLHTTMRFFTRVFAQVVLRQTDGSNEGLIALLAPQS